jgi:hypothetical protein
MATVRISKELRNDIIRNAHKKFDPAIKASQDSKPEDKYGDYIYDKIWGPYRKQMEALPKEFFQYKNSIQIRSVGEVTMSFIASFTEYRPIALIPANTPVKHDHPGQPYSLLGDPVWEVIMLDAREWKHRCDTVALQRRDFIAGVTAVLDTFTTLAPALKEWPLLWELLPEHIKDRHKEIKERVKTDKPSMDRAQLGAMTGALTAIKLGGM